MFFDFLLSITVVGDIWQSFVYSYVFLKWTALAHRILPLAF